MMPAGIWISESEVVDLMSLPEAIAALRAGLTEEAGGGAVNMVKTHATWAGGSTLHAIGAVFEQRGVVGTKTWAHTAGGASPLLVLMDANTGLVLAVIEAFALGQMRTGGISGVATDLLARDDARTLAIIGAGKQSLAQVAAVAAVRELTRVSVWSPTASRREALAAQIRDVLGIDAEAAVSLEAAVDGADVVTLATRARAPFLDADVLARGVHVNAIGAITPERAEFAPGMLARADVVAADSPSQVRRLSREFIEWYRDDEDGWSAVTPLSRLVATGQGRPASADLTLFKAMGIGISDLALGIAIYHAARQAGIGRPLPEIARKRPRLTNRQAQEVA